MDICSILVSILYDVLGESKYTKSTGTEQFIILGRYMSKSSFRVRWSTLILLTNYNLVYEMHHHHYCAYCYVFLSRYGMLPFSPFHAASSSTERQQNICLSFSLEKGDDVVHH